MNKTLSVSLLIFIILVGGFLLFILARGGQKSSNTNTTSENIFVNETSSDPVTPVGILTLQDRTRESDGALITDYYYRIFGEEKDKILEATSVLGLSSNVINKKFPYLIKEGDNYLIKIWDIDKSISQDIYKFPIQRYNFHFNSLYFSPDEKFMYAVVIFEEEDYQSRWNDPDFNVSEVILNTELYKVDIEDRKIEQLHHQKTNLDTYDIIYPTDDLLIVSIYNTEIGGNQLGFFDVNQKEFVKRIENINLSFHAFSPNGRYFAYNTKTFSKGGEFDPSGLKIIDLETLKEVTPLFISAYDFGIQGYNDTKSGDYVWSDYEGLEWGTDNRSLYTIKNTYEQGKSNKYSLYKIDLANEQVDKILDIPLALESPSLWGVYQDQFLISAYINNRGQLWSYPSGVLLAEEDYGFGMSQIVTVAGK